MRWIHGARTRLGLLFARRAAEARMNDEMRFHLEMEAERLMRERGLAREEAWRQAQLAFGGAEKYREQMRDGHTLAWLSGLTLDVKLGMRMLVKYPGLTSAGVLTIAIAIALAASWFEFMQLTVSPNLPIEDPDRVVIVENWDAAANARAPRALHDFETWRTEAKSLLHLTATSEVVYNVITDDERYVTLNGARTTPSAFELMGVRPLLGRTFTEADAAADAPAVVVLGHDAWQRLFDGDRTAIGRTVRLGGTVATVVGVMPEHFGFPVNEEAWTPLRESALEYERGTGPAIWMAARLAPGYSMAQANAELRTIGMRTAQQFPATHEHVLPRVRRMGVDNQMALVTKGLNLPFILFLIVVCANVATLVFARTATREGELAVRSALGASRRRLVLQLFAEALVLTSVGTMVGLLAANYGMGRVMTVFWEVQQSRPPYWFTPGISMDTVLYGGALALLAAALIGGIPALKATGRRLRNRLAQPGSGGAGMKFGAISTAVIIVQVGLSVAFLPIAIMNGQSLLAETPTELQFPAGEFLNGQIVRQLEGDAPAAASGEAVRDERGIELLAEVERRLAAEPGVLAVAFASRVAGFNHPTEAISLEDTTRLLEKVRVLGVDERFLDVMEARIAAGRGFRNTEVGNGADVVILDKAWAQEVFQGRNPIGQRIRLPERAGTQAERWHEVVGVVDRMGRATGPGSYVAVYEPMAPGSRASTQVYMRTTRDPDTLVPHIAGIVSGVDPSLGISALQPLEETWRPVYRSAVFYVMTLTVVAIVIMGFALIGIYALMSFTVSQRAREIGIRAALGADSRRILRSIFTRAFVQIGLGVVAGAVLISATVAQSPEGLRIVAGVAVLMLGCGLVGCYVPARRALRIQPTDALRAE